MTSASLSVLGLYNWDNTLFDLLSIPQGLDKDTLIDFILSECSELEVLYPNPEVLKGLIGVWSVTQQYEWDKLYQTMLLEYNPIENYNRTETRQLSSAATGSSTDGGTDTLTSADSGTDTLTSTDSGTDTVTSTDAGTDSTSSNSTDLKQVKAFDTSDGTFTDKEKDTVNSSGSTIYGKTNTNTSVYGKTNTNTTRYGHTNQNSFNKTDAETINAHGNIGVMSSQQMLEAERNVAKFNIYQIILDEFKQRYCLLVY